MRVNKQTQFHFIVLVLKRKYQKCWRFKDTNYVELTVISPQIVILIINIYCRTLNYNNNILLFYIRNKNIKNIFRLDCYFCSFFFTRGTD